MEKGRAAWTASTLLFLFGCLCQARTDDLCGAPRKRGADSRDPSPETQYRECKTEKVNEKGRAAWTA